MVRRSADLQTLLAAEQVDRGKDVLAALVVDIQLRPVHANGEPPLEVELGGDIQRSLRVLLLRRRVGIERRWLGIIRDVRTALEQTPLSVEALRALHLPVAERVPLLPTVQRFNQNYLDTKARRMRHWLDAALTGGNGRQSRGNGNGRGFTSTTAA